MAIRILAVGKKHEPWVAAGIERYEKRLRKPFSVTWQLVQHSSRGDEAARKEESVRLLDKIKADEKVFLLDERGSSFDSLAFAKTLAGPVYSGKNVCIIIGGSFGVDESVRKRSDTVISFSKMVFPHQLVRLILLEQLYRAQEINTNGSYHHV